MSPLTASLQSKRVLAAIVLLALVLHVWAYVANTALWLDEILLASNILSLPMGALLTQPLQLDQVAPRGFLLVEKLSVLAFGEHEMALRLFPFICGIAAIFLFRRLAERVLDGLAVPVAMLLFAIGIPFMKFGAEVKPYQVDAMSTILLTLLGVTLSEPNVSTRRMVVIGLFGFVVTWFSQASVVVMGGIGVALAVHWLYARQRHVLRALCITIPLWAAASLVAVFVGLHGMSPSTKAFMDRFWAPGFFPLPMTSANDLLWFWNQGVALFTDPALLRYAFPELFVIVSFIGIAALLREKRDMALLLLGPLVVALLAAVAHQFPFSRRLVFYLIPGLLLAIAAGAEWLRRAVGRIHPVAGGALMGALMVPSVIALVDAPPPYDIEHSRQVASYLGQHRQPGDVVYAMPLSRVGLLFYGPNFGMAPSDIITAVCDPKDTRSYLRDVDRFRGTARLWLLSGTGQPFRIARASLRQYLQTIGTKRDSLILPSLTNGTISLELFDLTDRLRLDAADGATYPVPPMPTDPPPGCRPWIRPSPLDTLLSRARR